MCDKYGNFQPYIQSMPNEESVILFMRKAAMGEKSYQPKVPGIDLDRNLFPNK